jgi:Tfp pilus assembly protein PilO
MQFGWRTFVFVVLLLAMLVFSYPLLFKPLREQREQALRQIAEKQQKLRDLENLRQNTAITRKEVAQWQDAIKTLEHRLPAATEMDKVLNDFWEKANANKLTVKSVRNGKAVEGPNYDAQPIRVLIEGPFNGGPSRPGFYNFLSQIEAMQRLTKISEMRIETDPKRNGYMIADVALTVYYEGTEKVAVAQ